MEICHTVPAAAVILFMSRVLSIHARRKKRSSIKYIHYSHTRHAIPKYKISYLSETLFPYRQTLKRFYVLHFILPFIGLQEQTEFVEFSTYNIPILYLISY